MVVSIDFLKNDDSIGRETKIPAYINYLIVGLWFSMIYAPFDTYSTAGELSAIQKLFFRIYFKFDLFQIVCLGFMFYMFMFPRQEQPPKYGLIFLIPLVGVIVLGLLNPNNQLTIGQYFYETNVFNFYYLFLISVAILYIEKETYTALFNRILTIGFYVMVVRSLHSLFMYFTGNGLRFNGGALSTIPQMDVLIYLSAFQLIALVLFLNTKNKIYLGYMLLFLATLFFSYRRSALGLGLIADILLMVYYFIVTPQKSKAIQMFVILFGALFILGYSFKMAMPGKFDDVFNRFAGAFSFFMGNSSVSVEYSDSGHMEQSIRTTEEFFKRAGDTFWGAGFGNSPFFVAGQTEVDNENPIGYIHNSFVQAWAKWGLHVTIFLVLLVVIALSIIIKLIRYKSNDFIIAGLIIFLLCYFILGWSNGILFLQHLQYIMMFVIFFSVIRFLPQKNNSVL